MEKLCKQCGKVFSKPTTVSRANWPKRLYCTKACQYDAMRGRPNPKLAYWEGKKQPPEMRAKRSESLKRAHAEGRMHVIDNTGLRRERTSQWKGDDIGYRAAHARLYAQNGPPLSCAICEELAHEWALRHDAVVRKAESAGRFAGKEFSPRPSDYFPACRSCHRKYDGRERDSKTGRYL